MRRSEDVGRRTGSEAGMAKVWLLFLSAGRKVLGVQRIRRRMGQQRIRHRERAKSMPNRIESGETGQHSPICILNLEQSSMGTPIC